MPTYFFSGFINLRRDYLDVYLADHLRRAFDTTEARVAVNPTPEREHSTITCLVTIPEGHLKLHMFQCTLKEGHTIKEFVPTILAFLEITWICRVSHGSLADINNAKQVYDSSGWNDEMSTSANS